MQTPQGLKEIKAMLICAACDIPASRKLGGFLGHAAEKGCSRCLKSFPTEKFGEKKDYSGFDRSKWPEITIDEHRKFGMSWKHASAGKLRKSMVSDSLNFSDFPTLTQFVLLL